MLFKSNQNLSAESANVGGDSMSAAERMNPSLRKERRDPLPLVAWVGIPVLVVVLIMLLGQYVDVLFTLFE